MDTSERCSLYVRRSLDAEDFIHPTHKWAGDNQSANAYRLVNGELHGPNPDEHKHETIAQKEASPQCEPNA